MKRLIVFLDAEAPRSRALRRLLARHPWRIDIEVLPMGGKSVRMCYPELDHVDEHASLVTLSDTGMVEEGRAAWRTVVWSLAGGVAWSDWLGRASSKAEFDERLDSILDGHRDLRENPASAGEPRRQPVGA